MKISDQLGDLQIMKTTTLVDATVTPTQKLIVAALISAAAAGTDRAEDEDDDRHSAEYHHAGLRGDAPRHPEVPDGFPDDSTVQKVYDNLDFMRGVEAFLNGMPGGSAEAARVGFASRGAGNNQTVLIMETLMDSKSLFLTPNTESITI
jgi:hypothetical protein